jgi:hypothetical protein
MISKYQFTLHDGLCTILDTGRKCFTVPYCIHPGTDINEAPSVLLIRWGLLSLGLLFSWTFSHIMDAAPVVSFLQQLITNINWLFLSCSRTSLRKRFLAYRTPYIQSFVSTTSFLCGSTYWTFCRGPCPSTSTISVPTVARFPPFRPFVMSMSNVHEWTITEKYADAQCLSTTDTILINDWMRRWEFTCLFMSQITDAIARLCFQRNDENERNATLEMLKCFIGKVVVIMVILLFHFRKKTFWNESLFNPSEEAISSRNKYNHQAFVAPS